MCRGPGDLGGNPVGDLRYSDLCDGQWASMLSLAPRVPIRKIVFKEDYQQHPLANYSVGFGGQVMKNVTGL